MRCDAAISDDKIAPTLTSTVMILDTLQQTSATHFERYGTFLNHQMVNVLKTLGFDRTYVRGEGQYLYDSDGVRYLDLLGGYGVFAFGRSHPTIVNRLKEALDATLPNLVKFDCPQPAAHFAERLAPRMPPGLEKFFFCNSGAEAVEGAIKFARIATGRKGILYCDHGFHGLTTGALAVNGSAIFKNDFQPLLEHTAQVPFDNVDAVANALKSGDFACFVVEPIQGKGVHIPSDSYFPQISRICRDFGTLLVMDEVQTGIGRTGTFLSLEHWPGTEPDIVTMAKALSGGFIPVGVIAMRKWIFEKMFSNMERSVIHSSTFSGNDLAMVAGMASLEVLDEGNYVERAAEAGQTLLRKLRESLHGLEFVRDVRGMGLMIGVEFGPPKSLHLKAAWSLLDAASKGLFCQMIIIPLFRDFHILTQVAGHNSYVIKLLPPLTLSAADIDTIAHAFRATVTDAQRFPGAIWDLGKTLAANAIAAKTHR